MKCNKTEAVIFDWAGTTVDYGCFAPVQAFVEVFKEYGVEPTMEETRKPMGMLKLDHIKTMLKMERINSEFEKVHGRKPTDKDAEEMHEIFEKKLLSILHNFAEPKPYVVETIAELRKMGVKIGSTTGYTDKMMEIVTREAKSAGYEPDCWFSPDSTNGVGRPKPYMVFRNLETLGVTSTENAIKVGDTVSDVKEGKNAGLLTIGIIDGSSEMGLTEEEYNALSEEEKQTNCERVRKIYLDAGADFVIQDIREILSFIK